MEKIIYRVRVCIVLHNILVGSPKHQFWENRDNDNDDDVAEVDEDNDECVVPDGPSVSSTNCHEQILCYMLV